MTDLAGLPVAERVMRLVRGEGATRLVATAPEAEAAPLLAHFGGLVKVSRDSANASWGESVRAALPQIVHDHFLVANTNMLWPEGADQPLARMLQRNRGEGEITLLCVKPNSAHGVRRSHDFCLDPAGQVNRDYGAPVLFAGVALLDRAALDAMTEDAFSFDALLDQALDAERLWGVVLDADWYNLASAEGWAAAERLLVP